MSARAWLDLPDVSVDPDGVVEDCDLRTELRRLFMARVAPIQTVLDSRHPRHREARAAFEAAGRAYDAQDVAALAAALDALESIAVLAEAA